MILCFNCSSSEICDFLDSELFPHEKSNAPTKMGHQPKVWPLHRVYIIYRAPAPRLALEAQSAPQHLSVIISSLVSIADAVKEVSHHIFFIFFTLLVWFIINYFEFSATYITGSRINMMVIQESLPRR